MNKQEKLILEFCKACGPRMTKWYLEKMRKKYPVKNDRNQ